MEQEQYRKIVYCDWGFLESLVCKQRPGKTGLKSMVDDEVSDNIRNMLLSPYVKLYLNMSLEDFDKMLSDIDIKRKIAYRNAKEPQLDLSDKLIHHLNLMQREGVLHLHFNSSKVQFNESLLKDNFLNAMFFSCEQKDICTKAMEKYGVIVICSENMNDFKYLFFDQGVAIRKNEANNWKRCLTSHDMIPCNALIVVDNYILNDSKSIEENLKDILDSIVPRKLSKSLSFHLTIFASLSNDRGVPFNSKSRFERINSILSQIRPDIDFKVSIIKCSKDKFHDRSIVSNNFYIGCGGGFDLFKNGKAQKTTFVCAFNPLFNTHTKWSRKAYSNLLFDASKVFHETSDFNDSQMTDSFPCFAIGDKQNRLLFIQSKKNR